MSRRKQTIPELFVSQISPRGLMHLNAEIKRTRRRFIYFAINGTSCWLTRNQAKDLIAQELKKRGLDHETRA